MKKILCALTLVAALFSVTGCSKKVEKGEFTVQKGKLLIGMEIGYPPFEYYAEDGKTPAGFDVDLGKALAEKLGLEAEFVDTAWDGILGGLDTNRFDVIMSAMTITDERKENYNFSVPYVANGQSIVVKKGSGIKVNSLSDLNGMSVGYQAETTSDFFMERKAKELNFEFKPGEYDKVLNAFDDLKYGRLDAVAADYLVSVSYLSKEDTPYECAWLGEADDFMGVCVSKENTVLLDKVNRALAEILADGTYAEISIKNFGGDLSNTVPAIVLPEAEEAPAEAAE